MRQVGGAGAKAAPREAGRSLSRSNVHTACKLLGVPFEAHRVWGCSLCSPRTTDEVSHVRNVRADQRNVLRGSSRHSDGASYQRWVELSTETEGQKIMASGPKE